VDAATEAALAQAGRALGGTVRHLRRLSGGASRLTSAFDLEDAGGAERPLILQVDRGNGPSTGGGVELEARLLRAAEDGGVPVPHVVELGTLPGEERGWLVVERLDGATIPRRILRDPEWVTARAALTGQCAAALARIHRIEPGSIAGLPSRDPLSEFSAILDSVDEVRPVLELGIRWLEANPLSSSRRATTVHGDFRMGNLLVGPQGLRAVLDWELAHAGDGAEDLGWLCARSWRFGGTGRVGGFGALPDLLAAYEAAGGARVSEQDVSWWEVHAAIKWAVICALQAATHLRGDVRSMELAAIGRRICEGEWDLLLLLGMAPTVHGDAARPASAPAHGAVAPFGRPTAAELLDAVREHLEGSTRGDDDDEGERFRARIAGNLLQVVARELELGPAIAAAHNARRSHLGFEDDAALAAAIRSGAFDDSLADVGALLAESTRDQLLVANPSHLQTLP
jgi:aminoglycoside phosphotransferase (APT) family kinase protein